MSSRRSTSAIAIGAVAILALAGCSGGASDGAAPSAGASVPSVAGASVPRSDANDTGVKLSLRAFLTPCAPIVMTPHVTFRQSTSTALPERSTVLNEAPGTVRDVDQRPSAAIVPPLAAPAVSLPGNATNRWKPWLFLLSLSGT